MGTPTQVCVWSCPNFSAPAGRPFRCVSDIWLLISGDAKIMPQKMRTRSAGRPAVESLGGGTCVRVGRDGRGRRPREESELWNHAMVGAGHAAYTDRFHELASNGSKDMLKACSICVHISGWHDRMWLLLEMNQLRRLRKEEMWGNLARIRMEERIWVLGPSVPPATPTMHSAGLVAHASTVTARVICQRIVE
ncbi:hypothetical protein Tco_0331048, partial [Tanacetum coccineum]